MSGTGKPNHPLPTWRSQPPAGWDRHIKWRGGWGWGVLGVLLLAGVAAGRPPGLDDVPPIDRRADHFYGAVADRFAVSAAWSVDSARVPLGGEFVLSLTITNAANPAEIVRPKLGKDPRFTDTFRVVDLSDPPPTADSREVVFRYALTPRRVGQATVPALKFKYVRVNPAGGVWRFTAVAYPLAVTVTPPAKSPGDAVPLDAPDGFFAAETDPRALAVPAVAPGPRAWLVPVALVPAVVAGWVVAWRRIFPDAARLAALRRTRAVRRVLDRLGSANHAADPTGEVAAAVRDYLVERYGVDPVARTPAELGAAAAAAGFSEERAGKVEALFRRCDAARFAPPGDPGASLAADAARLVADWEGDARPGTAEKRRSGIRLGIAVGLGLGMTSPATAAEPAWGPAAEAFAVGVSLRHDAAAARPHFAAAAAGFDGWWAAGNRTAAVARNRGRAHFLAGDIPRAVAAFREGLAIAPWDVGLQDDLAACRAGIPYPTETDPAERTRPDPVAGWRTRVSPADRLGFAVVASLLLTVGVARRLTARDGWAVPVAVVGFAGLAADGWVGWRIASEEAADREYPAAVVAADAVLRRGNGDSHAARLPMPLPAGVEVRVVGDRGGWVRVRVAGGATGWLPESAVVRADAPGGL